MADFSSLFSTGLGPLAYQAFRGSKSKSGSSRDSDVPKGYNRVSTLDPQQRQLFTQWLSSLIGQNFGVGQNPAFQSGQSFLNDMLSGSPEAFEKFEAPYRREFYERTIPALAERFSGLGAGSQSSSAFQQALGQAGAGLSENLASLRGQLQLASLPQALGYAQAPGNQALSLLNMQSQAFLPKELSFLKQLGLRLSGGIGQGLGMLPGLAF